MPTFASYDGTRLWYDTAGAGPPLVCLAGGPGADTCELGDLGGLSEHRTLVLLDSRAAGRSEIPADRATCAFTEQARDVDELRRHLGLDRLDLLAHSAGTLTAQEYAARFPTGKLVLVTPAGRAAREPDETEAAAIRAQGTPTRRPGVDGVLPPQWLRAAFYGSGSTSPERLARLAAVTAPVLALAGAADGIAGTTPARLIADLYPSAELAILPAAGHFPWLDTPPLFTQTILPFLA